MRAWMFGGVVAAVLTTSSVYFIKSGNGLASPCQPCISCQSDSVAPVVEQLTQALCGAESDSTTVPVTDVFDVSKALQQPAPAPALPFISFDEPPFAKPANPGVVQATFTEPARTEVAPMPREFEPLTPGVERLPAPRIYRSF